VAGVYPRVQNIASGSETAFGLRLWRPELGASKLDLHASAFRSVRGYEYYDLQFGRLPHIGTHFPPRSTRGDDVYELGDLARLEPGHLSLYASARYRHYPQLAYFGLGIDSLPGDRTTFLGQDALYEVIGGYQGRRLRGLAGTVRAGLLQAFVGPGTDEEAPTIRARFDDRSAPGLDRQPDFYQLGATLLFDRRDEPGNPHRGGLVAVGATRYDERGGDEFSFDRFTVDARGFASLGSEQRVLAARALLSADHGTYNQELQPYAFPSVSG
jgi:hypothetical protein